MTVREDNIKKFTKLIEKDISQFGYHAYGEALAECELAPIIVITMFKHWYGEEKAHKMIRILDRLDEVL